MRRSFHGGRDHRYILILFAILSFVNLSSCQIDLPRNIETVFPFILSPPPPPPTQFPEDVRVNTAPPNGPPPSSSKKGIVTAVAATAASAFVLAAAFFLLFTRISKKRRQEGTREIRFDGDVVVADPERKSEFKRFDGDEEGLDVLYWNKLSNSTGDFRQPQRSPSFHLQPAQELKLSPVAPPQPPKKLAPLPPPPPPPGSKLAAAPPPPPSSVSEVKLKPLHWEKVNINHEQSNAWDKIERGSFQYNGDVMEALFSVAAPKRKPSNEESDESSSRIFILDQRKSQNVAIVIKTLGVSHDELIESLIEGRGLSAETLEKLTRTSPTEEEVSKILAFNGDPSKLAYAEFFLFNLLKSVPSAFIRANRMLFRFNYASEIFILKEYLQTLESACNDLRSRGIFLKLLEAILKAGNRLNAGTARGNAKAFNLTTLRKLSDYKSSDGKTTLLHFVIHEVVRSEGKRCVLMRSSSMKRQFSSSSFQQDDPTAMEEREKEYLKLGLPVVGGLSSEFASVKKAANIDYDVLKSTLGSLATRIECELMDNSGSVVHETAGFMKEMKDFLELAKMEVKVVEAEHTRVMELVKQTTSYYQAKGSNDSNPLQLFIIVKDFLSMVDQACVEIARTVQTKKPAKPEAGSGSGSSEVRNRVTFPRLPKNFMSDKSSSGSDDDDS